MKNFVPKWSIRNLYFAYIQSIFTYGISLWGPMARKSSLKKLKSQQNKVVRMLDSARYNANASPIFKKWKILKLDDLCLLYTSDAADE